MNVLSTTLLLFLTLGFVTTQAQISAPPPDTSQVHLGTRGVRFDRKIKAELTAIKKTFERGRKTSDFERRLINAQYATFRTLTTLALILDRKDVYRSDILREQDMVLSKTNLKADNQKQLLNGITGMYTMYNVIYKMAFATDTVRISELVSIHDSIVHSIHASMPLFQALNTFSRSVYSMSRSVVQAVDTTGHLAGAIVKYDKMYEDGEKIARDEEDRFLNSIYRTFHMHELWAIYSAPADQRKASVMSSALFEATQDDKVKSKVEQIIIAMEYLYRITERLTLNLLRLFL